MNTNNNMEHLYINRVSFVKKKVNKVKMLSVDHCHVTGKIRGLLCHQCNVGLGAFKDSIENLECASEYLKATSQ